MDEKQVRAAVESAVRRAAEGGDDISIFVDEIMGVVDDYAGNRYGDGHTQGMIDEREVHFG